MHTEINKWGLEEPLPTKTVFLDVVVGGSRAQFRAMMQSKRKGGSCVWVAHSAAVDPLSIAVALKG